MNTMRHQARTTALRAGLFAWLAAGLGGPAALAAEVQGFSRYGGEWSVRDGILWTAASAGGKLVFDGATFSSGTVGVELRLPAAGGGNAGLIVRVGEPAEGADAFTGYEIALDASRQMLRLGRHRQNFELLQDVPCDVPLDCWIPLVVSLTTNTLDVRVGDKSVLTYTDREHPLPAGRVGLRPWQRPAGFRNLWIAAGSQRQALAFRETVATPAPNRLPPTNDALPPIAFITRQPLTAPPAVGQDLWAAQPTAPGCSIRVLDPRQPGQPARVVFHDPAGCIYDLNVSDDARTLFFSYRPQGARYWHVWRIAADGSGLRQLTDGPFHDVAPCETPDGRLVFVSTRRFGYTLCQPGPASNLHTMDADGANVGCVSMNTLSDMSPQMLPDGRILFTRWEYIDRDLTYRQSLWTQYPDGTAYQLYFGNTIRDVGTFWQARPLPGRSDQVVATFAPHHGFPHGAIGLIDRRGGPEGPKGKGFVYLTREFATIGDARHEWSYRDPFPLSDETFLCAYGGDIQRFRLYLLDRLGNKRLLHEEPDTGCHYPVALRAVPRPPRLPERVAAGAPPPAASTNMPTGTDMPAGIVLLADVYRGLAPAIARGRVKALRVMEQVRKTEDLVSRAYDQSPVMSYGTYYAKRSWGTVPVEADGSAHFFVPALREIYFQALDAEGRELQRMTSAAQLMPGERQGCTGCHEPRQSAPPAGARRPLAALQQPRQLQQEPWCRDGIVDFATVVQPVLDRYCVRCHTGPNPAGGYDLTGDKTRYFSMAYDNLLGRSRSYRQHNMDTGEMLPEEAAKGKPLVHFYWLLRTPTAVNQPLWTGSHASRLTDIVESARNGQRMPLADRQRIYLWIDANVPYYGTYAHSHPKSPGRRDLWTDPATGQPAEWFTRGFNPVYERRCASCHGKLDTTIDWEGRFAWLNLSRPAHSPALTAHLSKAAGGRQITTPRNGQPPPLFADTTDPDYLALLHAIETGRQQALRTPEADMPGFAGARPEP